MLNNALRISGRRLCNAAAAEAATPLPPAIKYEVKDNVLLVRLDQQGSSVNTLGEALQRDFEEAIVKIEKDPKIVGAVLISDKPSSWIAGADISLFGKCETKEDMVNISETAQKMFDRLEATKRPVVAAINGNCLGGGLETALACHYRIATTSPKTVLGVPEVMLGLLPGAGGTQRLPEVVGIQGALDLALTGKMVKAAKAKKLGLVDLVVDPLALEDSAIRAVKDIAAGRVKRSSGPPAQGGKGGGKGVQKKKKKKGGVVTKVLEETGPGRNLLFDQARKMVLKQSGGHYPAPLKILDAVRAGVEHGRAAGLRAEREGFGELGMTSVSNSLISIFHGQTKCKKNAFGKPAHPIGSVAVLGAGLMGSGIAAVSVDKGYRTLLKDVKDDAVALGVGNVHSIYERKVKRRSMTAVDRDETLSNLIPLADSDAHWKDHFASTDVVIEAVFESLDLKKSIVQQLEAIVPEHCVIATNTSALPIADIAAASKRPQNVVGMHYFSPVEKMPLLEVVTHEGTSRETTAAAVQVGLKQGKTVIVVKDGPGFYTTRILAPFMGEAAGLLLEGVDVARLDSALRKFGFPVGPVTLLDEVGIDVAAHIARDLTSKFGERMGGADPALMDALVSAGFLGRKSSKGFFLYDQPKGGPAARYLGPFAPVANAAWSALSSLGVVSPPPKGKPVNQDALELLRRHSPTLADASSQSSSSKAVSDKEIQERLVLRMVNEAAMCLEEGILADAVDGDIGAVFGLGFPPFLGGPFRYADAVGAKKLVADLEKYEKIHGVRFTPAKILRDHAENGTKFHKD